MLDKFEEHVLLTYVDNYFNKYKKTKVVIEKLSFWFSEYCAPIVGFDWYNSEDDKEQFDKLSILIKKKIKSFKSKRVSILEKNLRVTQNALLLSNEEKDLLGLFYRYQNNEAFEDLLNVFTPRKSLNNFDNQKNDVIATILGTKKAVINKIFAKEAAIFKYGLIKENEYDEIKFCNELKEALNKTIKDEKDFQETILGKPLKATLSLQDFNHISQKEIILNILKATNEKKEKGINILIYGEPGTGKTEFAKTICHSSQTNLYAVSDKYDEQGCKEGRYKSITLLQNMIRDNSNGCLLIDEADDIFYTSPFFSKKETKLELNQMLENNSIPMIWIINNVDVIDKAQLRRFSYALKIDTPNNHVLQKMWQKSLQQNKIKNAETLAKDFAKEYSLSPAFISTAVKSAKLVKGGIKEIKQNLDALETAYNGGRKKTKQKQVADFNTSLLNTDTNLEVLTQRLVSLNKTNFSLCLYGASGTGKSAFGEYIAKELGLPVVKKKCSDLMSMYVGECEQNIAYAFAEAQAKEAVLIFDEADSFLQDRTKAHRSWEITQVNEMLTQMEKHQYPFICTTNLMDSLDKASLRRFTFKVKYDYMNQEQVSLAFKHFFGLEDVKSSITTATPGDFVVIKNKAEILDCLNDVDELRNMLTQEQQNKGDGLNKRKIGFAVN